MQDQLYLQESVPIGRECPGHLGPMPARLICRINDNARFKILCFVYAPNAQISLSRVSFNTLHGDINCTSLHQLKRVSRYPGGAIVEYIPRVANRQSDHPHPQYQHTTESSLQA